MITPIRNYNNLFIADFSDKEEMILKIVFSEYPNFVVDGNIIYPFVEEVETGDSILVSNNNKIKRLSYYVNCFGQPRKLIPEKDKQDLIVEEIKLLKRMKKI